MEIAAIVVQLPARDRPEAWNWLSWIDGYLDDFFRDRPSLQEETRLRDEFVFVLLLWWLKRKYADSFAGYEGALSFLRGRGLQSFAFGQRGDPYSESSDFTVQWRTIADRIDRMVTRLALREVVAEPLGNFRILDRYLEARSRGRSVG